ncbi:thioredoxin [Pectobacterium polaris]|nr:thioredoxin [Pectobacterium polaris]
MNVGVEIVGQQGRQTQFDVDAQQEISQEVGVRAMPTFTVFQNGNKVDELVGAVPGKLEELVKKFSA